MDFSELFIEALNALTINKMRTFLATLGIVIGIGAVITLMTIGQAGQLSVQRQIQSLGSNLLTVIPGTFNTAGVRSAAGSSTNLTYEDAKAISASSRITTVAAVSPEFSRRTQVAAGRNNTNTSIIGAVETYDEVHKLSLASGTFITKDNVDSFAKVAVLGPQVVTDLFGENVNPMGETVWINKIAFKVTGTTVSKGGSGFGNQDDAIYVPLTTAQKQIFGSDNLSTISVEAKSENLMTEAQNEIGYFLLTRHKLNDPSQADFRIFSQEDILSTASQITGTFSAILSGIAAISLLVGGIGIMNIMLVTVTERTREIGLRKALGAKKKTVITQFLTESIILTAVGGVVGMILGIGLSYIICMLLKLPFVISFSSIVLAIGVSGCIGILFGWYPARLAANMSPIEALRFE